MAEALFDKSTAFPVFPLFYGVYKLRVYVCIYG